MQRHLFRGLRVAQQGGDAAPGFSVIPFTGGLGRVEGVGRRHGDQHHGVGGGYGADDVDVTLAQGQLVAPLDAVWRDHAAALNTMFTALFLHADWAHLLGNLVFLLIFGLPAERAVNLLKFSDKKAAALIKKLVESAIANAENNAGADIDALKADETITGGMIPKVETCIEAIERGVEGVVILNHLVGSGAIRREKDESGINRYF